MNVTSQHTRSGAVHNLKARRLQKMINKEREKEEASYFLDERKSEAF